MGSSFLPLRSTSEQHGWSNKDVVVIFGEVFSRGYVNGLIEEARRGGATVIFSTVGRRDDTGNLRPLNSEELKEKDQPLINIPLEAGFDMEPSSDGKTLTQSLQGLKLSEWKDASVSESLLEDCRNRGVESFRARTKQYISALNDMIPESSNVLFVHTMAGGVPRAKIVMPAMNRVFKGAGDRFASSEELWSSSLGKLCDASFMEVTAETLHHLIDLSSSLRERQKRNGARVSYVAYGYHGTEVLIGNEYKWQSYSPYLQGFAKLRLEDIAQKAFTDGVSVTVFNAPEILTNSSSVFLGVEVPLYQLIFSLEKELGSGHPLVVKVKDECQRLLKSDVSLSEVKSYLDQYFTSETMQQWSHFAQWPQHNGPEQMQMMRDTSDQMIAWHKDPKQLLTLDLSELVFKACGRAMWSESWEPRSPVWWIGHDLVARLSKAN